MSETRRGPGRPPKPERKHPDIAFQLTDLYIALGELVDAATTASVDGDMEFGTYSAALRFDMTLRKARTMLEYHLPRRAPAKEDAP